MSNPVPLENSKSLTGCTRTASQTVTRTRRMRSVSSMHLPSVILNSLALKMTNTSLNYETSAQSYSDNITRLTILHAVDLIGAARPAICRAKRILEIGCGAGAFGLAYLSCFPDGIPGQTIVCTDLSSTMVQIAQKEITEKLSSNSQTTFLFQEADGTKLDGFADESFDMVVSVFGIFLIPDRAAALQQTRRVLANAGTLATAVWTTTEYNEELQKLGFGANLHDAMAFMKVMPKGTASGDRQPQPLPQFVRDWFDLDKINEILKQNDEFRSVNIHRSIHSLTFPSVGNMWDVFISSSPLGAAVADQDPEQVSLARKALGEFVAHDGNEESTVFIQTASNIIVAV